MLFGAFYLYERNKILSLKNYLGTGFYKAVFKIRTCNGKSIVLEVTYFYELGGEDHEK